MADSNLPHMFDADGAKRIVTAVRHVEGSRLPAPRDGTATQQYNRPFWLAQNGTLQQVGVSTSDWTIYSGPKGTESSIAETIPKNIVYLRQGLCFPNTIYSLYHIDGVYEVLNPALMVRGYTTAGLTVAENSATFTLGMGQFLSATVRDGLIFTFVNYFLSYDQPTNTWNVVNPALAGDGICYSGCAKGSSATANIYQENTIGDRTDSGVTLSAYSRFATVPPGSQIRWEWNGDSAAFEMTAMECGNILGSSASSAAASSRRPHD